MTVVYPRLPFEVVANSFGIREAHLANRLSTCMPRLTYIYFVVLPVLEAQNVANT
jgi:hypothetical protein